MVQPFQSLDQCEEVPEQGDAGVAKSIRPEERQFRSCCSLHVRAMGESRVAGRSGGEWVVPPPEWGTDWGLWGRGDLGNQSSESERAGRWQEPRVSRRGEGLTAGSPVSRTEERETQELPEAEAGADDKKKKGKWGRKDNKCERTPVSDFGFFFLTISQEDSWIHNHKRD